MPSSQNKITSQTETKIELNIKPLSIAKKSGEGMSFNRLFTDKDGQPLEKVE